MRFTVKFNTCTKAGTHINGLTNSYGMDYVRAVKEEYPELLHVPVEDITLDSSCPSFIRGIYGITVPQTALDLSVPIQKTFAAVNTVVIYVPDGFLGKYYKYKLSKFPVMRKGWFGKSIVDRYVYDVSSYMDDDSLLKDWISAGCPTHWGVTDSDFDEDGRFDFTVVFDSNRTSTFTGRTLYDVLLQLIDRDRDYIEPGEGIYTALSSVIAAVRRNKDTDK